VPINNVGHGSADGPPKFVQALPFAQLPSLSMANKRETNPYLSPTNLNYRGPFPPPISPRVLNLNLNHVDERPGGISSQLRSVIGSSAAYESVHLSRGDGRFHGGGYRGHTYQHVLTTDPGFARRSIEVCKAKRTRPWPDLHEYLKYLISFDSPLKEEVQIFLEWVKCNVQDEQDWSVIEKRPDQDLLKNNEVKSHIDFMSSLTADTTCSHNEVPLWFELLHRTRSLLIRQQYIMPEDTKEFVDGRIKSCWFNIRHSIETNDMWHYNLFFKEMMYYIEWYYPQWMDSHYRQQHKSGFRTESKK